MPTPKQIIPEPNMPDEINWLDIGDTRLVNPRKYTPELGAQEPTMYMDYDRRADKIIDIRDAHPKQGSAIQIFHSADFGEIRTVMRGGEPWFVAVDVCRALEVANPSQALVRLDTDEKITTLISNESAATGKSSMAFINEPGLYSLVLGSRKPEARAFKRWITHEVIPAIRKTGTYSVSPKPQDSITVLREKNRMALNIIRAMKDEETARIVKQIYGIE